MCCACEALQPRVSRQAQTDVLQLPFAHCPHPCYLMGVAAGAGSSRRRTEGPQQTAAAESSSRCVRACRHNTYVTSAAAAALHARNTLIPTQPQPHLVRPHSCRRPVQQVECVWGAASCSTAQWAAMDHGEVARQPVGSSAVSAAYIRMAVLCSGWSLSTHPPPSYPHPHQLCCGPHQLDPPFTPPPAPHTHTLRLL